MSGKPPETTIVTLPSAGGGAPAGGVCDTTCPMGTELLNCVTGTGVNPSFAIAAVIAAPVKPTTDGITSFGAPPAEDGAVVVAPATDAVVLVVTGFGRKMFTTEPM